MKYLFLFVFITSSFAADLKTIAEKSGWKKTGRLDEVDRLCHEFAKQYPERVSCDSYGVTPEGRTLWYMVVGEKLGTAPVLWAQAGIHAGEIDGKDAVFWLMNDALGGKLSPDPLQGVTLVFIPTVNLDGHERVGKWNRPNQVGPEVMGWRTTAQNLNMNRDFAKADAPEMQALIKLWLKIDPVLSADLHVTDGADFQAEVGLVVNPTSFHGTSALHAAGSQFEKELVEKLLAQNHKPLPFYPDFEDPLNPLSGFARYVSPPRFAHGYWGTQNRLGVLVESHSWKDYATRVKTHRATVVAMLELVKAHAAEWKKAESEAEKNLAGKAVALEFKNTGKSNPIDFAGYAYEVFESKVSGAKVIKFDPKKPQLWKIPFFEEMTPSLTVQAPKLGYFVMPSEASWVKEKLAVHGIKFSVWKNPAPEGLLTFRATEKQLTPNSFEGRQMLTIKGEWKKEARTLPPGTLFVPIDQPHAQLVLQLLEPQAKDSFLAWGFFNRFFESKEYMENYVMEMVANEMLKKPQVKQEFEARLKADQKFAADPDARWEFFYRKHPSFDERLDLYPVFKR